MKIAYKHLVNKIDSSPSKEDLSEKLFQLGHEHEIIDDIFIMDFTPNRGDCLSVRGIIRDLKSCYKVNIDSKIFEENIDDLELKFVNRVEDFCPTISFLKVEVEDVPKSYNEEIESYFSELKLNKNNFFTDLSNYISYETGQPTHCYDASIINEQITLERLDSKKTFKTLLDQTINLDEKDYVFTDEKNRILNLAGIMGGKESACNKKTKSVLIECAYFNPEMIIGKTVKHNLKSESAYKFERNTDPSNHDYVLRRFLKILKEHCKLLKVQKYSNVSKPCEKTKILFDQKRINKILGFDISEDTTLSHLYNLGMEKKGELIIIPTHRHDVKTINDLAEEIARVIGYDNIKPCNFKISANDIKEPINHEISIKNFLIDNGFFEVINDPFVSDHSENSVIVDNPLDSNKRYLRTNLKNSLLNNLLYNERRQKNSVKLFEVTDLYTNHSKLNKRVIGIIASGRIDKNYRDFSKKIDLKYMKNLLDSKVKTDQKINYENILRENLNSKSNDPIVYLEIEINASFEINYKIHRNFQEIPEFSYKKISEFPSSIRDLSFSVADHSQFKKLQDYVLNFNDDLLQEVFIFDYFFNEKRNEIKIGFRFIFQDSLSTITETQVNSIMNVIINKTTTLNGVSIPGLK